MKSLTRHTPRLTDFHEPLWQKREREHKQQVRRMFLCLLPVFAVMIAWRFM